MLAVAFDLGHRKIIGLGAGIVIGAFLLATSAAMPPALPQLGGPASFDAGYLEPAVFIDDSLHAARQDAATQSDQEASPIFGMQPTLLPGGLFPRRCEDHLAKSAAKGKTMRSWQRVWMASG